jgi:GNAT superfamily N-acetyltransferase
MDSARGESFPFSDLALARRLERAEARSNAGFVEARAAVFPDSGACWIEVAGAYAMFDGVNSPSTQTFGLGLLQPVTSAVMEEIEEFFQRRGAPVFHEVSPLADIALLALLNERGYQPIEFTSVMVRPIRLDIRRAESSSARIQVRLIREEERELWAQTSARGWSELTEYADLMLDMARVCAQKSDALSFIAELEGQPIATGAMILGNGVALLAGASTIPEARRQGAQLALLEGRLHHASEQGCDLAMMCAAPGSSSQRNAERNGFRIAYTRIKWRLAHG